MAKAYTKRHREVPCAGINGPSSRQASVKISQHKIDQNWTKKTNGLMSTKPWPKDMAGALSGGIIGPKPW